MERAEFSELSGNELMHYEVKGAALVISGVGSVLGVGV